MNVNVRPDGLLVVTMETVRQTNQPSVTTLLPLISPLNHTDKARVSHWLEIIGNFFITNYIFFKYRPTSIIFNLFVCGISLTSGQLINELFPDCAYF